MPLLLHLQLFLKSNMEKQKKNEKNKKLYFTFQKNVTNQFRI